MTHRNFGMTSPQVQESDPKVFVENRPSRTGSNYGRSFCSQCSVDLNASPPSCSFSRIKEPRTDSFWVEMPNGTGIFWNFQISRKKDNSRGEPKFSKRISGNFLFHLILNRNFWKFWSNGMHPIAAYIANV